LIFNYRLSRARRIIENAFGILVSRWRVYKREIIAKEENVELIVKATVCLHNFLMHRELAEPASSRVYCPSNFVDSEDDAGFVNPGDWRTLVRNEDCISNLNLGSNNYSQSAARVRMEFERFFTSAAGRVSWQEERIRRGQNPVQ